MQVAIPHSLGKDEVRARLRAHAGELAQIVPGGLARVETSWPGEDRMDLSVSALGQSIIGAVEIEAAQVLFTIDLPPALAFAEALIRPNLAEQGRKLLG